MPLEWQPLTSTRIYARLKRVQEHSSRVNINSVVRCARAVGFLNACVIAVGRSAVNNGTDALRRVARLQPDVLDWD